MRGLPILEGLCSYHLPRPFKRWRVIYRYTPGQRELQLVLLSASTGRRSAVALPAVDAPQLGRVFGSRMSTTPSAHSMVVPRKRSESASARRCARPRRNVAVARISSHLSKQARRRQHHPHGRPTWQKRATGRPPRTASLRGRWTPHAKNSCAGVNLRKILVRQQTSVVQTLIFRRQTLILDGAESCAEATAGIEPR